MKISSHKYRQQLLMEDEKMVLRAFGRKHNLCIHELRELTGIQYPELHKIVARMISRGEVAEVGDVTAGKDDKQYLKLGKVVMGEEQFIQDRLSPLMGMTEDAVRGRVTMIKRMKSRLICEWHPILDILLGDYEKDLMRVEALREPPEANEPRLQDFDVLDRDLDLE